MEEHLTSSPHQTHEGTIPITLTCPVLKCSQIAGHPPTAAPVAADGGSDFASKWGTGSYDKLAHHEQRNIYQSHHYHKHALPSPEGGNQAKYRACPLPRNHRKLSWDHFPWHVKGHRAAQPWLIQTLDKLSAGLEWRKCCHSTHPQVRGEGIGFWIPACLPVSAQLPLWVKPPMVEYLWGFWNGRGHGRVWTLLFLGVGQVIAL